MYAILGWISVGLGLLGVVLPVLPTTPFMILAAFLFAKGSPRARAWLVGHKLFGQHILHWEESGTIERRVKRLAVGTMAVVFLVSVILQLPIYVLAAQFLLMFPAALFVWTRPEPNT